MRGFKHFWNETWAVCREQPRTQPAPKLNLVVQHMEEKINTQGSCPQTQPGRKKETRNRANQALLELISSCFRQYLRRWRTTWTPGLCPQEAGASTFKAEESGSGEWEKILSALIIPLYSALHVSLHSRIHPKGKGSFFRQSTCAHQDGAAQGWGEGSTRVSLLGPKPEWFTWRERSCLSPHSSSSLLLTPRTQTSTDTDKSCRGAKGPFLPLFYSSLQGWIKPLAGTLSIFTIHHLYINIRHVWVTDQRCLCWESWHYIWLSPMKKQWGNTSPRCIRYPNEAPHHVHRVSPPHPLPGKHRFSGIVWIQAGKAAHKEALSFPDVLDFLYIWKK